ncbi:biotin/lipoyl-binding protein [Candidatus Kapabacteria bacterium]|nr:biotin/lipoyl-binding protein [Candidatus Kapabacteria bacterium]
MRLKKDNTIFEFDIQNETLTIEESSTVFDVQDKKEHSAQIVVDGNKYDSYFFKHKDSVYVNIDGKNYTYKIVEDDDVYGEASNNQSRVEIYPPMPGSVVKLLVDKNQEVKEGDGLIVVEAMKMETTLYSPIAGKVKVINIKEKEQLNGEEVLIVIEK